MLSSALYERAPKADVLTFLATTACTASPSRPRLGLFALGILFLRPAAPLKHWAVRGPWPSRPDNMTD